MAATESEKTKKCVSPLRILKLELVLRDLNSRMHIVEECLLGMDGMRIRMIQLEKSMENALDRIMPRLDALLAGLPTSITSQLTVKPALFPSLPSMRNKMKANEVAARLQPQLTRANAPRPSLTRPKAVSVAPSCSTCGGSKKASAAHCICNKQCVEDTGRARKCSSSKEQQVTVATKNRASSIGSSASSQVPVVLRSGSASSSKNVSPSCVAIPMSSPPTKKLVAARPIPHRNITLDEQSGNACADNEDLDRVLREAATAGDRAACEKAIMEGGDPRKRDPSTGDLALHCAAREGHLGCVMILSVVCRNTIISTNKQHQTPLMLAASKGHAPVVRFLLQQGKPCWNVKQCGDKALLQSASEGKDDVVRALLEGGVNADPAEENHSEPTPLHVAATNGHALCVHLLLEKGANISFADTNCHTPLHKAAMNGHNECVAFLLSAGANPLLKDASGWEPLHLAARAGHIECVKLLLALGVDVNRPASVGNPYVMQPEKCAKVPAVNSPQENSVNINHSSAISATDGLPDKTGNKPIAKENPQENCANGTQATPDKCANQPASSLQDQKAATVEPESGKTNIEKHKKRSR